MLLMPVPLMIVDIIAERSESIAACLIAQLYQKPFRYLPVLALDIIGPTPVVAFRLA
jgi:hypothetical protein